MENKNIDFTVNIKEQRDIVILQLTDMQIIDSSQKRYPERLSAEENASWKPENMDVCCFDFLRETVTNVNPDFIFITGDLIYGSFDDKGTSFAKLTEFMDSFKIPWAPVFGNHDEETCLGADWLCNRLENSEYCLFKRGNLTGNGNYTVGISHNNKLLRIFFMLDSNGYAGVNPGFGEDQINWYEKTAKQIKNEISDIKFSFAFHIQPYAFKNIFDIYGFKGKTVCIDNLENKRNGDFGIIGNGLKYIWDEDYRIYNSIKNTGADSIFVGHEHSNSASVVYDGIRLQFGQKSSTYDRANYKMSDGSVVCSYSNVGKPLVGGTVIVMSDDGKINNSYIYYCEN